MTDDRPQFSAAWQAWRERADLDEYNQRWDRLEADGHRVHDEALFVDALADGRSIRVLDAGCGTGRVAAELARRGHRVVGADNDPDMLAYARAKPEPVTWVAADLGSITLAERFDVIVLAGDVLRYVEPAGRPAAIAALASHLETGGRLVAGAGAAPGCTAADHDRWCREAGLTLVEQYATWDRDPYDGGPYRVSVHRLDRG